MFASFAWFEVPDMVCAIMLFRMLPAWIRISSQNRVQVDPSVGRPYRRLEQVCLPWPTRTCP